MVCKWTHEDHVFSLFPKSDATFPPTLKVDSSFCCRRTAAWEQSEGSNQRVSDHYGKSTGAFVLRGKAKFTSSVCIILSVSLDSAFPRPTSAPSGFALVTIKGLKWMCVCVVSRVWA